MTTLASRHDSSYAFVETSVPHFIPPTGSPPPIKSKKAGDLKTAMILQASPLKTTGKKKKITGPLLKSGNEKVLRDKFFR